LSKSYTFIESPEFFRIYAACAHFCHGLLHLGKIIVVGYAIPAFVRFKHAHLRLTLGNECRGHAGQVEFGLQRIFHGLRTQETGKARLPTHINIAGGSVGLTKDSIILLEQVRTIDKRRLREHMGRLDDAHMALVDNALAVSFGLTTDRTIQ